MQALLTWLAVLSRELLSKSLHPGISESVISNKGKILPEARDKTSKLFVLLDQYYIP